MNKINIKLFDELVISEYDLSLIISNYAFPRKHYESELRRLMIAIPEEKDKFKIIIIKNKDKIKFRTKNIIFIGYDKKVSHKYYFLQLTTKLKDFKQSLYFEHISGFKVYINTNKMFYFNFMKQKCWLSKFNNDKRKIIQKRYWKSDLLNSMSSRLIKSLAKKTNLNIYKIKVKEREIISV